MYKCLHWHNEHVSVLNTGIRDPYKRKDINTGYLFVLERSIMDVSA